MQLIYDKDADALEISLADGIVARTIEIDSGTLVDVDENGHVVAIELIRPERPWPLEEILERFALAENDAVVLRGLQVDQDFALEPAAPLVLA